MATPAIRLSSEGHAELESFLADRIYEFNVEATGLRDGKVFASAIRSPSGDVVAGVTGHTWGGTCHITYLWVHASHRHAGLGTSLVAAVELEAQSRGCHQIVVATHSFQAPAFYERLGYRQHGGTPQYPRGHAQLYYVKSLQSPGGA